MNAIIVPAPIDPVTAQQAEALAELYHWRREIDREIERLRSENEVLRTRLKTTVTFSRIEKSTAA